MYRFHYQQIVAKYGNKAKLTYTDTESFVYLIETKNIYDDMAANIDTFRHFRIPHSAPVTLQEERQNILEV